jgi:hypothetical protein
LLLVKGSHGRSSVLVVGPMDIAHRRPLIMVVGPRGHSSMVGVGPHRRSWALVDCHGGGSSWPIIRGRGGPSLPCIDGGAGHP